MVAEECMRLTAKWHGLSGPPSPRPTHPLSLRDGTPSLAPLPLNGFANPKPTPAPGRGNLSTVYSFMLEAARLSPSWPVQPRSPGAAVLPPY